MLSPEEHQLFVLDTVVRDNGGSGILIRPGSWVGAMLDGVRLDSNFYGLRAEVTPMQRFATVSHREILQDSAVRQEQGLR